MTIQYLHVLANFNCSVKFFCDKREVFFINSMGAFGEEIDLKIVDGDAFEIQVLPHNKKNESENISYSAKLYFDNDFLFCDSRQVEVYKLPQGHFFIKLLPASINNQNFAKYDKIESGQSQIKTLKVLPTLTKKARVEVYDINGDLPILTESYFVNLDKQKVVDNIEILKFVEFFENLQFKEYEALKDNLSATLSEKLTTQKIVNFFGDFKEIKAVNYYDAPAVVLFYNNKKARVFSATFNRMMIDNIFEIE